MCWSRSRRSRWCSPEQLGEGETPLLKVVQAGAPNFPIWIFGFITMFAVANSALINMLMASRLVYGMSREHVLPPVLGTVHRHAAHALTWRSASRHCWPSP
jgi:amino acid transporter